MDKIKVGDWVKVKLIGFGSNSKYMVEKIEEDNYTIIQKEGSYKHRMIIKEDKIEKL
tara:strand:+ start:239 stop:409 length:171 start_codon:yes stop_codon:yes gene_type:complete